METKQINYPTVTELQRQAEISKRSKYVAEVLDLQKRFQTELGLVTINNDLKREIAEKQMFEAKNKIRSKFVDFARLTEDRFNKKRTELLTNRNKIKFPLFTSAIDRSAGATEINSGIAFISSSRSENQFIDMIDNAMKLNRYDFVFTIVDYLNSANQENRKSFELKWKVNEHLEDFLKRTGLAEMESEILDIEAGLKALKQVKNLLDSEISITPTNDLKSWQEKMNIMFS